VRTLGLLLRIMSLAAVLPAAALAQAPSYMLQWGSFGSGPGQFREPIGVAVDAAENVYVVDYANSRVQKFTSDGAFLLEWGGPGGGNGQFWLPIGVAVDPLGNVYVADAGNDRVQKFTSAGTYLTQWGVYGQGPGEFD